MYNFKEELTAKAGLIENWLKTSLRSAPLDSGLPENLREAMEYSLFAGGKRIRPVLCLSAAELFIDSGSPSLEAFLPFASAFEFIHTYSLIHDDLPAMDDDDLRRGKPSNHKQFTEATAILAGDGLLTDAFALVSSNAMLADFPAERLLKALHCLARAAGSSGMVGGQFYDMEYTGRGSTTFEELAHMHSMKTGALLTSPCQCGAILAGASDEAINALTVYGSALGAAFQITDDILDVVGTEEELGKPVGSDAENDKLTYPSLMGLDKSRELAAQHIEKATTALGVFAPDKTVFLRALAQYILSRAS